MPLHVMLFRYRPDLDNIPTQPPMMTFKQFLQQQDDHITDEDAIKKFNEYKIDFKKQQINEFFLQHKDEEWCVLIRYANEAAGFLVIIMRALVISELMNLQFDVN